MILVLSVVPRSADGWLTFTEAARRSGLSRATIQYWIRTRLLPSVKVQGQHCLGLADLAHAQALAHVGTALPVWRRDPAHTGRRLRQVRKDAGLNQQQLAAATELTNEAISHLEPGSYVPYPQTLRALAQALGIGPIVVVSRQPLAAKTWSSAEVAAFLDVSRVRVECSAHTGTVPAVRVSGQWRFPREPILELERRGRLRDRSRRLDPRPAAEPARSRLTGCGYEHGRLRDERGIPVTAADDAREHVAGAEVLTAPFKT